MADETRIVPIKVNEDGTMSFYVAPEDDKTMGFPGSSDLLPAEASPEDAIKRVPAGLLSGDGGVRVHKLIGKKNKETGRLVEYLIVAGNSDAFTPPTSLPDNGGRWVDPNEFAMGPLPEGGPSVRELRKFYIHSLPPMDRLGLIEGINTVRSWRHPDYLSELKAVAKIPADQPLTTRAVVDSPWATILTFVSDVDKGLPALHLPPGLNRKPNKPFSFSRRTLMKFAGHAVTVAAKLPMLTQAAERAAKRLQVTGEVPKPV